MKEIVLADIRSNAPTGHIMGHFIPLAKNYQELFKDKYNFKVAGGTAYLQSFNENDMIVLPYNINGTTLKDKLHTFANCKVLFKECEGKCIIFQQSSIATAYLALTLFYHHKSKIYVIQYSKASIDSTIKKLLYRFAKNKIDGVICPNDEVGKAYDLPYIVVPDYIYTAEVGLPSIPFEEKQYDFCMIGRLSPEKGVPDVVKSLRDTKFKVLIAGKPQNEALSEIIRKECKGVANIELHLGYINDENYIRYMQQSRYCILNYQGEYSERSSGVVYDMLFNGCPVVGKNCKALKFVEDMSLGRLYDDITKVDFRQILKLDFYNYCQNNIMKYCQSHKHYKETIVKFVSE